jgi:hypothetical protein
MTSPIPWLQKAGSALLLLVLASVPVQAAGIGFKSNIPIPIIVQGHQNVDNMLRRGAPVLIAPGKLGWDLNLKKGIRFITIYDARQPTRVLFQDKVDFLGQDMLFTINRDPRNAFRVLVLRVPQ